MPTLQHRVLSSTWAYRNWLKMILMSALRQQSDTMLISHWTFHLVFSLSPLFSKFQSHTGLFLASQICHELSVSGFLRILSPLPKIPSSLSTLLFSHSCITLLLIHQVSTEITLPKESPLRSPHTPDNYLLFALMALHSLIPFIKVWNYVLVQLYNLCLSSILSSENH